MVGSRKYSCFITSCMHILTITAPWSIRCSLRYRGGNNISCKRPVIAAKMGFLGIALQEWCRVGETFKWHIFGSNCSNWCLILCRGRVSGACVCEKNRKQFTSRQFHPWMWGDETQAYAVLDELDNIVKCWFWLLSVSVFFVWRIAENG